MALPAGTRYPIADDRPTPTSPAREALRRSIGAADTADAVETLLRRTCHLALDELGVDAASVSLSATGAAGPSGFLPERALGVTVASAGPLALTLERLEMQHGEGPGHDVHLHARPILTADLMASAPRWPGLAPAAIEAGIAATFAVPLHVGAVRLGLLHLVSARPRTLTGAEIGSGVDLGVIATEIALHASTLELSGGLESLLLRSFGNRDQIYQAQGMVMVDLEVGLAEALALMRAFAFAEGLTLGEVATSIVHGRVRLGRLPPPDRQIGP